DRPGKRLLVRCFHRTSVLADPLLTPAVSKELAQPWVVKFGVRRNRDASASQRETAVQICDGLSLKFGRALHPFPGECDEAIVVLNRNAVLRDDVAGIDPVTEQKCRTTYVLLPAEVDRPERRMRASIVRSNSRMPAQNDSRAR